jgi:hypothetical protein
MAGATEADVTVRVAQGLVKLFTLFATVTVKIAALSALVVGGVV